ncbi:unnamed protein product [Darwinula stevensoni]|uniref:Uncharacterized protein n=1 Tax=Darwinula stevensoni TaxID=69355 RepID=A0A7R8WZH3_9CRUS|nr:unnamed protein product [Darwinula stevensoni]CAG0880038.1 unnamed protein product [Darwinula stevensoni]
MMSIQHVTSFLCLLLVPLLGGWVRGESSKLDRGRKCCPDEGQYGVFHPDTGALQCLGLTESVSASTPFPECKSGVKLVTSDLVDSDPSTFPHCRGKFLVGDGENATVLDAFLLCPSGITEESEEERKIVVRKCCPPNEGYDMFWEKCIPLPFNWTLSAFSQKTRQFRILSQDEYRLRIDDLSSDPCKKHFLSPTTCNNCLLEHGPVFLDTGRLHVPALNFTFSSEQFCLETGFTAGRWVDLAQICHPTEKKLQDCAGKVCVQKCCPENEFLWRLAGQWTRCGPAGRLWDPRRLFRSDPPSRRDIRVISGLPVCPILPGLLFFLNPETSGDPNHKFSLTETGRLTTRTPIGFKIDLDVPHYCIDETRRNDGKTETVAWICTPRVKNILPVVFVLVPTSSALLLVVLLALFSPERRCLPGKIRLLYVGCLTIGSISDNFNLYAYDIGISNGLCFVFQALYFFGLLSSFFWLNVMSFDLWRNLSTLRTPLREGERKALVRYGLYAFGVSGCLTVVAYCVQLVPDRPPLAFEPDMFLKTAESCRRLRPASTLYPPSSTLHPPPSILHPPSSTLHPPPSTLHPPSSTLCPPSSTLHSLFSILHQQKRRAKLQSRRQAEGV